MSRFGVPIGQEKKITVVVIAESHSLVIGLPVSATLV